MDLHLHRVHFLVIIVVIVVFVVVVLINKSIDRCVYFSNGPVKLARQRLLKTQYSRPIPMYNLFGCLRRGTAVIASQLPLSRL